MSLLGMLTGADAAKKAAGRSLAASRKEAAELRTLGQPGVELYRESMPMLRDYVGGYLRNQLDKDSPIIEAGRQRSIGRIGRTRRASLAGSERFFTVTGNRSLGAGERFRINQAADEAVSDVNLGAAELQETRRSDAADRYFAGVNSMLRAGEGGANLVAGGARMESQGAQAYGQQMAQASMMNSGFMMNLLGMYMGSKAGPWN